MLGLPPSVRIYFATELVDMRNGIDGLRAHRRRRAEEGRRTQGHLFVFVGKAKDKVKILFWDRNGFVLYLKRLERGRFQLPVVDERTQARRDGAGAAGDAARRHRPQRAAPGSLESASDKGIDTDRRM